MEGKERKKGRQDSFESQNDGRKGKTGREGKRTLRGERIEGNERKKRKTALRDDMIEGKRVRDERIELSNGKKDSNKNGLLGSSAEARFVCFVELFLKAGGAREAAVVKRRRVNN